MDPISALSLSANIFQVIGFTVEVIRVFSQIHERGSLQQFDELEAACLASSNGVRRLKSKWFGSSRARSRTEDNLDPQLIELSDAVVAISEELHALLKKIRGRDAPDPNDPTLPESIARTALASFHALWHKGSVEALEQRLKATREDLQFHLIVLVKTRLDEQSHMTAERDNILKRLDESTKAGLRSAAGNLQNLVHSSNAIAAGQEQSENLAHARHEELISLIRNLTLTQLTQDPRSSKSVPLMLTYVDRSRRELANIAVVSSLWFPTMQDREDGISEAHRQTFTWVLSNPAETGQCWDDLGHFLRAGSGIYWVTGKPGSGKSTLMKYINRNDQTVKALQSWTVTRRLNTARFYFYYNGTKIQKSQIGVFRQLLHQLLEPRPDLVRHCFGDRYMAMCFAPEEPATFIPTVWELKRCLERLVNSCELECFFLSVDGLDEYDADDTEMAALAKCFEKMSVLPNVKSLLSSRPLETFEQAFKGFPRLRLHDLTRPDITSFVQAQIHEHHGLERLIMRDSSVAQEVIDEIVEASSGVFLWVHLVVRSLLEGLQNYDELDDLRRRLRELPTDLADLYQHMWGRVPLRYRCQASRLLQIVEAATADGARLSVMGLSFAYESDEDLVYTTPVAALDDEETNMRHKAAKVHIGSRCMGLVEISCMGFAPSPLNNGGLFNTDLYDNSVEYSRYKQPHVVFIHRTVSEFISSPDIRQQLIVAAPGFVATEALARSSVHRIKTYIFNELPPPSLPKSLESLVYYALGTFARAETATCEAQAMLMLEFDRTLQELLQRFIPGCSQHWSEYLLEQGEVGAPEPTTRIHGSTLLSLSVRMGLSLYVQEQMGSIHEAGQQSRPLLDYALRPYCRNPTLNSFALSRRPEIVDFLLSRGCDPNERFRGKTVWQAFLECLVDDAKRDGRYFTTTPAILMALLRRGADPKVKFMMKKFGKDQHEMVLYDVKSLFGEMSRDRSGFSVDPTNWVVFSSDMRRVIAVVEEMGREIPAPSTSNSPTDKKMEIPRKRRGCWSRLFRHA